MKEQLISFETAKLAKEKKFYDINVNGKVRISQDYMYDSDGHIHSFYELFKGDFKIGEDSLYNAPTQSLLQKWLREKHNIHVNVSYDLTFTFKINGDLKGNPYIKYSEISDFWGRTYEEALEKGLQEALKMIKI